ncbi:MAG TPA: hypothetical protein VG944_04395, partial [Fimbriimonas sp.]|nr:hypothetical protein [Fimbriimonas sp.]
PMTDEVTAPEFEREEQYESALETLEIPGIGLVQGGGSLATAALDFAKLDGSCNVSGLVEQLTDDGVPQEAAHELQNQFRQGRAILAVVITPGELNEDAVEEIAERNGAQAQGLFDAPRYYDATLR